METEEEPEEEPDINISYSLGDAIDWKLDEKAVRRLTAGISYSLGDAIDWKQQFFCLTSGLPAFSYSLGDAIDWKLSKSALSASTHFLLLARGRDRLETESAHRSQLESFIEISPTR